MSLIPAAMIPCPATFPRSRFTTSKRVPMRFSALALSATALLLTGCSGLQSVSTPAPIAMAGVHGSVFGGQQPIAGALVQIYQAGTTGYGTGATGLISGGGVLTGTGGDFHITGLYTCTPGSQVYIVASGGNPGFGGNNPASMEMAGLGLCDNLSSSTFIQMNEVTTIGSVYALAQFMNGVNIGAPATNQTALAQAFADVNTLVNIGAGVAPGPAAPANATVPAAEINALANSIAACINSTGTGPACTMLFTDTTPAGGTAPTDVLSATINIARGQYPVANANSILNLASSAPPFSSTFTTATDLTLSVTYSGAGIAAPTAVAIDAGGNVWVANGNNSVSEIAHSGVAISGTGGFAVGGVTLPTAIAIDGSGNAWVANANNSLAEVTTAGGAGSGSPFVGGGLASPTSIAFDAFGNIWLANSGNNSLSEFSPSGTAISSVSGFAATGVTAPVGVAINPR